MTREQIKTILIMLAGAAAIWILWDYLNSVILGLLGIGGAAAAMQKKADISKIEADEHVDMMNHDINQAVVDMKSADEHREKAVDIAEKIQAMPDTPKPGKARKRFEIR